MRKGSEHQGSKAEEWEVIGKLLGKWGRQYMGKDRNGRNREIVWETEEEDTVWERIGK